MYIEFGRGSVPAPPLSGLMALADRFDGTVAISAEGISIYLPFNEELVVHRDKVDKAILAFETYARLPLHRVELPSRERAWVPEAAYGMGNQIRRMGSARRPAYATG